MGEIVGAALVAHVPTIVLPEATRHELNEGKEISLVATQQSTRWPEGRRQDWKV